MDCSPPGSSIHKISQARILEWVAISSSRGSSPPRGQTLISCINKRVLYCWDGLSFWKIGTTSTHITEHISWSRVRDTTRRSRAGLSDMCDAIHEVGLNRKASCASTCHTYVDFTHIDVTHPGCQGRCWAWLQALGHTMHKLEKACLVGLTFSWQKNKVSDFENLCTRERQISWYCLYVESKKMMKYTYL